MADATKIKVTNHEAGPRGFQTADKGLVMLDPGQSATLLLGAADARDAKAAGFTKGGKAADADDGGDDGGEPGPLDGSIADLTAHIEGIDDADEIQRLIDAETAGKSRIGALAALNDRLTAINGEGDE
jgi:hypothetical protein